MIRTRWLGGFAFAIVVLASALRAEMRAQTSLGISVQNIFG
jgi:hypothetical protein